MFIKHYFQRGIDSFGDESCCYDVDISLYIGHSRPRRLIDAEIDWFTITGSDVHWMPSIDRIVENFRGIYVEKLMWMIHPSPRKG